MLNRRGSEGVTRVVYWGMGALLFFLKADPGRWGGTLPVEIWTLNFFSRLRRDPNPTPAFLMHACVAIEPHYRFLMRLYRELMPFCIDFQLSQG